MKNAYLNLVAPSPSKYRAQPIEVDGIKFASRREAKRWSELELLQRAGQIRELRRQVSFDLTAHGIRLTRYIADFVYLDCDGSEIVEDSKGIETATFKLKRKWMKAEHNIKIRTV